MFSRAKLVVLTLMILMCLVAFSGYAQNPAATPGDPFQQQLQKGKDLVNARKYAEALEEFKKANKMKNNASPEAFYLMAQTLERLGRPLEAIDNYEKVIRLNPPDKILLVGAHNAIGGIYAAMGALDPRKLKDAEGEFRKAIECDPTRSQLYLNLGVILMRQKRDEEGKAQLTKFLEMEPSGPQAQRAFGFLQDPRKTRQEFAQEFTFTTLKGETISLASVKGKVLVLHFWSVANPQSTGSLGDFTDAVVKKYGKDPSVVIVSVSGDRDSAAWKKFIGDKKMDWHQANDGDNRLRNALEVNAYPSCVIIGPEGAISARLVGLQNMSQLGAEMKKAIKPPTKDKS